MSYNYFACGLNNVPTEPSYTVWFASWVPAQNRYSWSTQRPTSDAPTWGVWATTETQSQPGATTLGSGGKDLPPPPLTYPSSSMSDFQKTFSLWLDTRSMAL